MQWNLGKLTKRIGLPLAAICIMLVPSASACPAVSYNAKYNSSRLLGAGLSGSGALTGATSGRMSARKVDSREASSNSRLDITGMWEVTQTIGGQPFDHALEQFYADGNEMQNSAVVPPVLGNICFGVWERVDNRTFKMKHYGWNFDVNGNFTGTFFLTATLHMTDADNFTGTFVTDTLQLSGLPDPALHGEGTVVAKRIKLE